MKNSCDMSSGMLKKICCIEMRFCGELHQGQDAGVHRKDLMAIQDLTNKSNFTKLNTIFHFLNFIFSLKK